MTTGSLTELCTGVYYLLALSTQISLLRNTSVTLYYLSRK